MRGQDQGYDTPAHLDQYPLQLKAEKTYLPQQYAFLPPYIPSAMPLQVP